MDFAIWHQFSLDCKEQWSNRLISKISAGILLPSLLLHRQTMLVVKATAVSSKRLVLFLCHRNNSLTVAETEKLTPPRTSFRMPPRYSCLHTLNSIQHSITCLQFSRSGRELAVGSVDGNLKIFAVDTGKELQCFSRATAVTAILWHPSKLRTLFVGYEDGKLNIIGVRMSRLFAASIWYWLRTQVLGKPCPVSGSNNFVGPVTSLDYSLRRPYLAVASGQNIHLLREDLHGK